MPFLLLWGELCSLTSGVSVSLPPDLGELIQRTRCIIEIFSKAKAAKLIRELVDQFLEMEATTGNEVGLWNM